MLEPSPAKLRDCVHGEHKTTCRSDCRDMQRRPAGMSPYRIGLCLAILGWSERELARRTGRHQTEVRRWMLGSAIVDPDVAKWLTSLEQFFREHPAPRLRPMLKPRPKGRTTTDIVGATAAPSKLTLSAPDSTTVASPTAKGAALARSQMPPEGNHR